MKRIITGLSLILLALVSSCTEESLEQNKNVLIRVENISDYDFDQVMVNTSGGEEGYGTVPSGAVSSYQAYEFAYSFATVELRILGTKFAFTPIDYTGETRLTNGSYTYQVDVDNFTDRSLTLRLK